NVLIQEEIQQKNSGNRDANSSKERAVVDGTVLTGEVQEPDLDGVEPTLTAKDQRYQKVIPDQEELNDRDGQDGISHHRQPYHEEGPKHRGAVNRGRFENLPWNGPEV